MSEPARILFTIPNFVTAGSGRAMLNVIERLDRARIAPSVCVNRRGGALEQAVEALGIPLLEAPFTVPVRPYGTLLARARRAAHVFRPHRFEIWHSFHYADDYTEPIVARMAGARAWVFTKKNMGWGSRAWGLRSLLATRIAVQNTDMMRDFYGRWPLRGRARLVPRGVVAEQFAAPAERPQVLRARLGIPADAVVATCVAHLVPVKGHPILLTAAATIPTLHVVVAGKPLDAAYTARLHAQAAELGVADRVHFIGGVTNVGALLAEADVFAFPTIAHGEGCPVALLEAQAAGRACIATDVPGSRDQIRHGENGLLVPPEDSRALATALQTLVSSPDLRDRLGAAARQTVLDRYRIEREVHDHAALYDEILRAG